MGKIFAGIDPSLTNTGVVLLQDGKVIKSQTNKTDPSKTAKEELERLRRITSAVADSFLSDNISLAALEAPSFCSKSSSIVQLSGLNFFLRQTLFENNIPFLIVPPMTLKKFVGKGNMKKEEVKLAVYKRWGFEDKSNDITDAYALARFAEAYVDDKSEDRTTLDKAELIK